MPWTSPLSATPAEKPRNANQAQPLPSHMPSQVARCPTRESKKYAVFGGHHLVDAEAKLRVGLKSTAAPGPPAPSLCAPDWPFLSGP